MDAAEKPVRPAYETLVRQAADGDILHNDDTTARILALLEEQDEESKRKGIFTTGIVSIKDDRRIAIFMTGRNHAGENLDELLKARAKGLDLPIQMCDALSRNVPKEFQTILANCVTHARRQFVDVADAFPQECRHVIKLLGKVYHHDELARVEKLDPDARLKFHQEKSGPVMEELKTWCESQIHDKLVEPNSGIGKAIQYLLNHWVKLTRFLKVPKAPIDNNICYAASGITDVMPTAGLCRVESPHRPGLCGISDSQCRMSRHNHRLSRKASKGSWGMYRSGTRPEAVAWERACSLSCMSACK